MNNPQQFASDNYAGICPEAWTAMAEANDGSAAAYGDDPWTLYSSPKAPTVQYEHTVVATRSGPLIVTMAG